MGQESEKRKKKKKAKKTHPHKKGKKKRKLYIPFSKKPKNFPNFRETERENFNFEFLMIFEKKLF